MKISLQSSAETQFIIVWKQPSGFVALNYSLSCIQVKINIMIQFFPFNSRGWCFIIVFYLLPVKFFALNVDDFYIFCSYLWLYCIFICQNTPSHKSYQDVITSWYNHDLTKVTIYCFLHVYQSHLVPWPGWSHVTLRLKLSPYVIKARGMEWKMWRGWWMCVYEWQDIC